jgi:hypothetical protein
LRRSIAGQIEGALDGLDQRRGRLALQQVEGEVDDPPPLSARRPR